MEEIERIKAKFKLQPHPEGGFFGAGYRSQEFIRADDLPNRYSTPRNLYSSIYFMVTNVHSSRLHKLKTDEMWHFYMGDPLTLHLISEGGQYSTVELTNEFEKERFQFLVKRNTWMAASCNSTEHNFSLAACTLAPGFEFDDFELGNRADLQTAYPHLADVIFKFS